MNKHMFWALTMLLFAGLGLSACTRTPPSAGASTGAPARVEKIAGSDISRVILTQKATERLGIVTAAVTEAQVNNAQRKVVPYGALLYDAKGETWVFTNPEPLVYVRAPVKVDTIQGDRVVLSEGPAAGTAVVTVGAAELIGTEFGVGH